MKKICLTLIFVITAMIAFSCCGAEIKSKNPILNPQKVESVETDHDLFNILVLGIDYTDPTLPFGTSGKHSKEKKDLTGCHTDAILVVSVDQTDNVIRLLSLPRDTLTYVPGVNGIYKLNAAFNCADDIDEGFERACEAVSWLCGGISIDAYAAVDVEAMITLCDVMGGVDYNLEMTYNATAKNGGTKHYYAGQQHMDGWDIFNYVRARRNATVEGTDMGRTGRQRRMMIAIFQKLRDHPNLIAKVWNKAMSGDINFYTNIKNATYARLSKTLEKMNGNSIESYVFDSVYMLGLGEWNFNFTKQDKRQEVLSKVFGINADELPYISYKYTEWLKTKGFSTVRTVKISRNVLQYSRKLDNLTPEQQAACEKLEAAHDDAVLAFDQASDTMQSSDYSIMIEKRDLLRTATEEAATVLGYPEEIVWNSGLQWYRDPLINECNQINWN